MYDARSAFFTLLSQLTASTLHSHCWWSARLPHAGSHVATMRAPSPLGVIPK